MRAETRAPRGRAQSFVIRAGLGGRSLGCHGEIPVATGLEIDGRLWDPSVAVVYGSSTIRAATRPASTSAMASFTWSSGRVSRITRVLPAA